MVSSARGRSIGCLVGGLLVLGCSGETVALGGLGLGEAEPAAMSGSRAPVVAASPTPTGMVVAAPTMDAGAKYEGEAVGASAGAGAGAEMDGEAGTTGEQVARAGSGPARWRRRGSGSGGAGTAADGGAGSTGMQSTNGTVAGGESQATAAGRGAEETDACAPNLACQLPATPSTGDAHQDCVDRINQFRQHCACLPPLERWVEGEACADEMAKYDSAGSEPHGAFGAGICDGGSAQNECPGWRSEAQIVAVCLQRMWDEGPPPISDCTGSCFQMYGHFLNMSNRRMTKVACGFYETADGAIWSVQNFAR